MTGGADNIQLIKLTGGQEHPLQRNGHLPDMPE